MHRQYNKKSTNCSLMKSIPSLIASIGLVLSMSPTAGAADAAAEKPVGEINQICPISKKPVDPKITTVYEGQTFAFAEEACRVQFLKDRENSLYHKLGGKAAIDAAVDAFYVKVLADDRIKHFFDDVNMTRQHNRQKAFLSAAFGGPNPWTGKDMRAAHKNLPDLNDSHFNAVAENLQKTLEDLKVPKELIDQVMAIAASTRDDVLNRKPEATK